MYLNNKQNTGKILLVTRIDVYETLCPKQMLVHKGGQIKNWGGECRDVTPTKLQCQNIQRAMQVFYNKKNNLKKKNNNNSKKIEIFFFNFHQLIYSSSSIS